MEDRWYAETRWNIDDVICAAKEQGTEMTPEQAHRWWLAHEKAFARQLVRDGNEILVRWVEEVN